MTEDTDADLLAEWADRVVDAEEDRLLAGQLGHVLAQVHLLLDRGEAITALRPNPPDARPRFGRETRKLLTALEDRLTVLADVLEKGRPR